MGMSTPESIAVFGPEIEVFEGGALGAFTGQLIEYEWVPDPLEIANAILRVANYLDDVTVPLERARAVAIADTKAHFDTETAPDGSKWQQLDADYLKSKLSMGYPPDILRRTGDLEDMATYPSSWVVSGNILFFNTAGIPWYGRLHQTGMGEEINWGLAGEMRERIEAGAFEEGESAHSSIGVGRGMALPQRQWLGLSFEAEAAIFEAFDEWANEGIALFQSPVGDTFTAMGSNIMGEFPVIGHLSTGQPMLHTPKGQRFGRR